MNDAESEDEDDIPDPVVADEELAEKLTDQARRTTSARISRGSGSKPFIMTTKLQAVHVATSEMGSQAALYMVLPFLGVAALLLWARFG